MRIRYPGGALAVPLHQVEPARDAYPISART
jgi:hypothetical protein